MIDFIFKSTASLLVLLIVYHLLLENEKMHHFNRFYLLFAIVFSFIVPFITIEVIQEITTPIRTQSNIEIEGETIAIIDDSVNYWLYSMYTLYGIITSILLIRFVRNILKLHKKAKSIESIAYQNSKLVLVKEQTLPYTFLNNIFINETEYNSRKIEPELFTHELIHVTQKHTLDILFIETLKVLFWFNPILIFYKKAIQVNHEFLADEKVVESYNNVPFYQNLLIAKANANPTYYLASNLNYSVTKKRLIMMTKTTSVTRALLKKGVMIPVLTALVFSLCTKVVAQDKKVKKTNESTKQSKSSDEVWKNTVFIFRDANKKIIAQKKYNELTDKEKNSIPPPPPPAIRSTDKKKKQVQKNKSETIYIDMSSDVPKMSDKNKVSQENMPPSKIVSGFNISFDTISVTSPNFPGGMTEFYKFVGNNFKLTSEAEKNKVSGKIIMQFMVEKDGSLSEIIAEKDLGYGLANEAIRVLKLSPKWIPATKKEKPVRVQYNLPITIRSAE